METMIPFTPVVDSSDPNALLPFDPIDGFAQGPSELLFALTYLDGEL